VAEEVQRVAIVTGGTRGIGAAVVGALTAAGLAVASFDVEPPTEPGPDRRDRAYLTVDVSQAGEVNDAVGAVAQRFGRIDVLVNNAGVLDVHAVHDTPEDAWDRVMAVNVKAVFLMSRAVIPHLKAAGGGCGHADVSGARCVDDPRRDHRGSRDRGHRPDRSACRGRPGGSLPRVARVVVPDRRPADRGRRDAGPAVLSHCWVTGGPLGQAVA
jgi:NAD(P)-dependent dehydrogenase (short-subunit alcohol dehydrogenase family)